MIYYGHYSEVGEYRGFYTKELHGENIPSPYVKLNEEQRNQALSGEYIVVDGKHVKGKVQKKEEVNLEDLRFIRNSKLKESDWTQLLDSPLTEEKKLEWREYRQRLRDITKPENLNDDLPLPPK